MTPHKNVTMNKEPCKKEMIVDSMKQETLSWVFKICMELNYITTIIQK